MEGATKKIARRRTQRERALTWNCFRRCGGGDGGGGGGCRCSRDAVT